MIKGVNRKGSVPPALGRILGGGEDVLRRMLALSSDPSSVADSSNVAGLSIKHPDDDSSRSLAGLGLPKKNSSGFLQCGWGVKIFVTRND